MKKISITNFSFFRSFITLSKMTLTTSQNSCERIQQQVVNNFVLCDKEELNLKITLNGGQSFRWVTCKDENSFRGVFANAVWTLSQSDDKLMYIQHGSLKTDIKCDELLFTYFRLDTSLKECLKEWANADSHFETTYDKIGAVRILNQDVVENLFSFICSSNNNITRISSMVEKLCRHFGEKICEIEGEVYYDFPSIEALSKENVEAFLRKEGFGYRAGYIVKSAQKLLTLGGRKWLLDLQKANGTTYEHARESLMTLPGVGPKVADCICLMSLGHLEAIPVDTHIFQVACANYIPHLRKHTTVTPKIHHEINSYLRELWGPLAGWAQAIVFCVKINSTDSRKNKRFAPQKSKSSKTKTSKKGD